MKKIYVGNLPFATTDDDLGDLFAKYGEVISSKVITDRDTGRSRGFGFVEMEDEGFEEAVSALDGSDLDGRALKVAEAKPRGDRAPRRY